VADERLGDVFRAARQLAIDHVQEELALLGGAVEFLTGRDSADEFAALFIGEMKRWSRIDLT
jgi:hypothetical protein